MLASPIRAWPLPYMERLAARPLDQIDLVVMHSTELPDLATAREYGERLLHPSGTGNSGHYYIDRGGAVACFVEPARVAHHVRGYNPRSIGIELVNLGRYPLWLDSRHQQQDEPFPEVQIHALLGLIAWLRSQLPSLRWIAGHEDLDRERVPASDAPDITVFRKRDPGPMFPWHRVEHAAGLQRLHGETGMHPA
ncbi:MAG TPA: N-acetylmuramoyl-L-alanine amidase [Rhodanobacteraceae bacterium]|nr:N-acetylmuramoyl-L-alanine amidase [Rhodanobacteraceae bacterium]